MKPLQLLMTRRILRVFALCAGVFFACLMDNGPVHASCIDLSDVPLDVLQEEAPGIIMFCIDDSGSMDWSMVCPPPEPNGVFDENYYIFENPGDDHYTGSSYSQNLEDNDAEKMKWQSQWNGYNYMYYDPETYYAPWPGKQDADINNPRSNPVISSYTLNMNALWYSWGGGAGSITTQDIIDAGGVIVDNSDTGTSGDEVIELILDNNNYYNSGIGSFSTDGSSSSAWGSSTSSSDWQSNYLYSSNSNKWCVGTWTFTNLVEDDYEVYVWYVESSNRGTAVNYKVYDNGDNQVASHDFNQRDNGGEWRLLASGVHLPAGNASVQLKHYCTSTSNNRACADAVKLVRVAEATGTPDIEFVGEIPPWGSSSSGEEYGDDYLWTPTDGITYTATWTANILDPTLTYDVLARWAGGSGYRSDSVAYTVTHDDGTTTTYVDQNDNLGEWRIIAQGVNFSEGAGLVTLEHTRDSTYDRACADAVAFMPAQAAGGVNDIARPHYYVQNDNGTFLVNLINNTIEYYRVELDNPDDIDEVVTEAKLVRLTDDEAVTAGIRTAESRSYEAERQNFANWYSFYRRRELSAKNAIANVIASMNGVYIGIISINGNLLQRALPVRVTLDGVTYDQSQTLLDALYAYNSDGNTPLRPGLEKVGKYFKGEYLKPTDFSGDTERNSATYPYFITEKGGSCEQSFAIVMTDGYWTEEAPSVGNADADGPGDWDGDPFADGVSNTLADVAMYYYETDLNTSLADDVPITPKDQNTAQHMVTYTVSFGVSGDLVPETYNNCPLGECPDSWPNPFNSDSAKIDDMLHAAINGRGIYISADSPTELSEALQRLQQDIESRLGSAAALATNAVQRTVGTVLYQGTYNTAGWFGEVKALKVDVGTGALGEEVWRASAHVPEWNSRKIFSYNGSSGIVFLGSNLTATQGDLLEAGGLGAEADAIVDFIRGDTSNNTSHGGDFRVRTNPIGDIVHSSPTYFKGHVYIGANDGMLHAIDAATGEEEFCYVPNLVYDHLSALVDPGYSHRYYVDATAEVASVGDSDLLVCGLGQGGKGYFCLDVTSPDSMTADKVKWEYPTSTDDDMGYSYSRAEIAKTRAGQVVIFGNGYDSVNQSAVLYVLNTADGSVLKKIDTGVTGCNGLSTPALVDVDVDGYVDFAFAGDLRGNMWKFDLRGDSVDGWRVYYTTGTTPMPLVTVKNAGGIEQPITAAPEVMLDCVISEFGDGLMVIFGTGRYLTADDLGDTTVHTFYGIWDWSDLWEQNPEEGLGTAQTKYLGTLGTDRSVSNVSEKCLQGQIVELTAGDYLILTDNPVDWYDPVTDLGTHMGWFFDLQAASGERGIREPLLRANGVVVMTSTIPSDSPCEAGGSSVLYQLDACTGGRTDDPQFDVDGDNDVDDDDVIDDLPPTGLKHDRILFEPLEIGPMLYLSDSEAGINPMPVPKIPTGMLFWRMLQ
jgi:type IV pilus assembly protein PilY1